MNASSIACGGNATAPVAARMRRSIDREREPSVAIASGDRGRLLDRTESSPTYPSPPGSELVSLSRWPPEGDGSPGKSLEMDAGGVPKGGRRIARGWTDSELFCRFDESLILLSHISARASQLLHFPPRPTFVIKLHLTFLR